MRVLIVHAHPEPTSFNAAMTRTAVSALQAAGHEVVVSDLHAMQFDPVSDRRNFVTVCDPARFDQQTEESHASRQGGYTPALQAEMDKLSWCTALILQFPLYWLSMPAILKGWIDRVFAVGRVYGGGRWFAKGMLAGKLAMCSVTVGGPPSAYAEGGIYRPMSTILYPIHHGTLGFVGFSVLEPFVVFGPKRLSADERAAVLTRYGQRIAELASGSRLSTPDL